MHHEGGGLLVSLTQLPASPVAELLSIGFVVYRLEGEHPDSEAQLLTPLIQSKKKASKLLVKAKNKTSHLNYVAVRASRPADTRTGFLQAHAERGPVPRLPERGGGLHQVHGRTAGAVLLCSVHTVISSAGWCCQPAATASSPPPSGQASRPAFSCESS